MKLVISDLKANIFMIENHNRIANRNSVFDGLTNIIEPEFFICISYEPSDSFFSKLLNCEGTGELIDVKMFFTIYFVILTICPSEPINTVFTNLLKKLYY